MAVTTPTFNTDVLPVLTAPVAVVVPIPTLDNVWIPVALATKLPPVQLGEIPVNSDPSPLNDVALTIPVEGINWIFLPTFVLPRLD